MHELVDERIKLLSNYYKCYKTEFWNTWPCQQKIKWKQNIEITENSQNVLFALTYFGKVDVEVIYQYLAIFR